MIATRRHFLLSTNAFLFAPAIIRASSLMPISAFDWNRYYEERREWAWNQFMAGAA